MELKVYFDFLRRRWWLLILGPLFAGLAAYMFTQQLTPMFRATATILVNRTTIPGAADYNDVLTSERLTNTYVQLVERPAVLDSINSRLGLNLSRAELEGKISVAAIPETQLLEVSVSDADPAFAAQLANTTAQAFADDNASQLAPPGTVSIAKEAAVPTEQYSPKLFMNLAMAIVFGTVAAVAIGYLLDYLDNTVKTAEGVEEITGAPVLGSVGKFDVKTAQVQASEFHSRSAEAYRQLRTNIRFTSLGVGLKTIVVTSANPGEGKSTTASNLAAVLAQAGDRVILVDADLRRSSLRKTFDGPTSFGLTGLLYNDINDPSVALVTTKWKNLRLLPAGVLPPNPSELLTSARMLRVIESLQKMADYVIFDTPPVLAVTDAIVLAARTDGTILVTEANKTRIESLREAAHLVKQANARLAGVVLNRAKVSRAGYYYYRDEEMNTQVEIEADARKPGATALPQAASSQQPAAQAPRPAAATPPPAPVRPAQAASSNDLLRRHLGGGSATPLPPHTNGNGHSTNGNGHGTHIQAVPVGDPVLSGAVTDLLSQMNDTMGLIRSLKPGSNREEPRGL